METDTAIDGQLDLVVEDTEIETPKKPAVVNLKMAGQTYKCVFPKDVFWLKWVEAADTQDGIAFAHACEELVYKSVSENDEVVLRRRLSARSGADALDTMDFLAGATELVAVWEKDLEKRMKLIGREIPKQIEQRIAQRRKSSK